MNSKIGKLFAFLALVATSILAFSFASAQPEIAAMNVYLNSHFVDTEVFSVERGTILNVKVLFKTSDISEEGEVRVKAWIDGYRDSIEAETERFDIFPNRIYSKSLNLRLPSDMEEGEYTLHVLVTGKQSIGGDSYKQINLAVQRSNYKAEILSIDLALPAVVKAGESLMATTVVKNRGSHKIEDIYVKAEIVELGLSKTIYIGDLYARDYADNTERDTKVATFSFSIPKNTKSGDYTLKITASSLDASAEKSASFKVEGIAGITEEETGVSDMLTILTPSERKEVEAGKTVSYEIVLVNLANTPITLELKVIGVEGWAKASLSKSLIVLPAKGSETISVNLEVDESALTGGHIFSVQAISNNKLISSKNLVAEVKGKAIEKEARETGLWIVVAILGAIALALLITLIVLLVRERTAEEEKPEEIYY